MRYLKSLLVLLLLNTAVAADGGNATPKLELSDMRETRLAEPVDGVSSAGQPTADDLAILKDNGYVAVIDLRGPNENRGYDEPAVVDSLGMTYVSLPVTSAADVDYEFAAELQSRIAEFDGPVLVHCGSANRVGALLALSRHASGASEEAAIEYGRQAGLTRLESVVRQRVQERESEETETEEP